MNALLEPLTGPQSALVNLVWSQYAQTGRYPIFNWVDHHMRQQGHDSNRIAAGTMPWVELLGCDDYGLVWMQDGEDEFFPSDPVGLTIAGLHHVDDEFAQEIVNGFLAVVTGMRHARRQWAADHPYDMPDLRTEWIRDYLPPDASNRLVDAIAYVAKYEQLAVSLLGQSGDIGRHDYVFDAGYLVLADPHLELFGTVEQYLDAVVSREFVRQEKERAEYRDPMALPRAITAFGTVWELVLGAKVVVLPAADRVAWFSHDASSHSDLQTALSALGELLAGLQVPGGNPSQPTGRLFGHLTTSLPAVDRVRVAEAIELLDAVRHLRNSGVHAKPAGELLEQYRLLGLRYPIMFPGKAWDAIRAAATHALTMLHEEMLAARPQ